MTALSKHLLDFLEITKDWKAVDTAPWFMQVKTRRVKIGKK